MFQTINMQIRTKDCLPILVFQNHTRTRRSPSLYLTDPSLLLTYLLSYSSYHLRALWFINNFLIDGNSKISRFSEMRNLSYWRLACDDPWSRSLIGSACMTSRHQMRLSDLPPGALRHWVIATDHAESTGLPPLYWLIWLFLINYV